ncbi:MAG: protein kinase, partial [Candidatus Zixiibacteriota bacterium]
SIGQILDLSIQICDGLKAADKAGIVHRDIKPSNILIDSEGRPRIVDFGLASSRGSEKITMTGSTMGTVGYMSPEQARGQTVDHRSDLFSLGVVMYEIIAGRRPFRGEDEAATLLAVTQDTPEPISRHRGGVPDELERIVAKLLEKDPASRYQSAEALLADLTELKQDVTSGVSRPPKKRRLKGRKLVYAGLALVMALAAFAAVSAYVWHSEWLSFLPGTMTPEERVLAAIQAGSETCRIVVAPFWGQTDEAIDEGKVMQALVQKQIAQELAGEEDVEIFDDDISDIPRSHEQAKALGEKHNAAMVIWGEVLVLHGEVEIQPYVTTISPGRAFQRAASVFEANLLEPNQLDLRKSKAEEIGDMAILVAAQYYYRRKDLEKAMAVAKKVRPPTGESLSLQGAIAWAQGKDDEEEQLYRQALELDSGNITAYLKMARVYSERRQWDSAFATYEAAQALDPENESVSISIAQAYRARGQYQQSISHLESAIDANPESSALHAVLGWSLLGGKRTADAVASLRRAIELDSANGDAYYGLGWVYEWGYSDSLDQAAFNYSEAIRIGTRQTGRFAPHLTLGRVYAKQEKYEQAVSELLKAVRLNPWYLGTYNILHSVYFTLGWSERGVTLLRGLIPLNPDNVGLRRVLIWFYIDLDWWHEVIREGETIVRLKPEDGDAHADLGNWLDRVDSLNRGAACYQEALRLGTKRRQAYMVHYRLAWNFILQSEFDDAVGQGKEILAMNPPPNYARGAHWITGHAYICQDRYDEAVSEFQKAIAADSTDVYAHFYYTLAVARSGKPEQAREHMQNVSGAFSDSSWSGWIIRFLNGEADERSFLNEAARADTTTPPEHKLCEAYYFVGITYLLGSMDWLEPEHADTTRARDYFEKCVATDMRQFYEYRFARTELARLEASI